MGSILDSDIGKINLLKNNPRKIRDNAFDRLVESIERDEDFLRTRGIVVWKVPEDLTIPEGGKSPFDKQQGKLVVIGGNMRCSALKALGKTHLKKEWLLEAKEADGSWWSPDKAERFCLIDNGSAGIAGENDYEKLASFFNEANMRLAGIDFSEFQDLISEGKVEPMEGEDENGDTPEDVLEKGEDGEKSQELQDFIAEREKTRRDLKQIDNTGFYLLCIFDDQEAKAKFVADSGLCGKGGKVVGNGTNYVVLVFESEGQKMEFAEKAGLLCDDDEGDPRLMYGMFCDGRYIASKMGIELADSGLHFRDRKVSTVLADMARDEAPQLTPTQIAEKQFQKAKEEREAMGMPTGRYGKKGKKGKVDKESVDKEPSETESEAENGEALFVSDEAFE